MADPTTQGKVEPDPLPDAVREAMNDVEALMSAAWPRLTEVEQEMGQRILDRLRPHAAARAGEQQ